MAVFKYEYLMNYSFTGGTTYTFVNNSGPFSRELDDQEPDATFEVPDQTSDFPFPNYNFQGTLDIQLTAGGTLRVPITTGDTTEFQLYLPTGMTPADVILPASFDTSTFNTTPFPVCFAKDTQIATAGGARPVQTLEIGDLILSVDGREVLVKWLGRQTVHKLFTGIRMEPVCIRAGALGDDLPHSDLTVTADHGMIIDGLVINASALVNGGSIDWVPMADLPERVTYYHIETEAHDVILANGAPAETFVDIPGRMAFDNYAEYTDLYGAERIIPEMDRPRISSRRLLSDEIRKRLGIVDDVIDFDMLLSA